MQDDDSEDGEIRPILGRQLGGYTARRLLGRGGMGEVYELWNETLRARQALKVPSLAMQSNGALMRRFVREAKAAARIDHPNVLRTLDAARFDDGQPYILMEYVDGPSLRRLMTETGPFDADSALCR